MSTTRPVRRHWLVGSLALSLSVFGLTSVASVSPAVSPVAAAATAAAQDEATRPDSVSAMVTARASGKRVEDESQRDERTRTYANPDGSWTSETASEPEAVQDRSGEWHDIDTTLVERDGQLVPKYAATDVAFSAGGDKTFASVSERGKDLAFQWPTVLPAPSVEGNVATYADVVPDGDLVVTALPTGFSHDIVLHERPTGNADLSWTVSVQTDGAQVDATDNGGLVVSTSAGKTIVEAAQPVMYDASTSDDEDTGDDVAPLNAVAVETSVSQSTPGKAAITLTADGAYLSDPDTAYPVTVDPTFVSPVADTWVDTANPDTGHGTTEGLLVGYNGSRKARSYMRFTSDALTSLFAKGPSRVRITSAQLKLRNYSSLSCASAPIRVNRIIEDWAGASWNNQPTATATGQATYSPAWGGGTSCAQNWASWDLTDMAKYWLANPSKNYGVQIKAFDETSTSGWRQYRSANYVANTAYRPDLIINYNSLPGTASTPNVSPLRAFYTSSLTPKLSARVGDPDGGTTFIRFEVRSEASNTATLLAWCDTPYVPQNTIASCTPSTPLPDNSTVLIRAKGGDGALLAGGTLAADAGWSDWVLVITDASAPGAPTVSGSNVTEGLWSATRPPSNAFTVTSTDPGVVSFSYRQDFGTARTLPAINGTATVTWNPSAGSHTLTVQAVDQAGNLGAEKNYTWGVGGVAISADTKVPTAIESFPLSLSGPPGATSARLQWRYAAENSWNQTVNVRRTDGAAWAGGVTAGQAGSEVKDLIWKATDELVPDAATPGATIQAPAMLEVRACFAYAGSPDACSSTVTLQLVQSAFGGNFPDAEVGPGRVALWTGEFAMDSADVSVPGGMGTSVSVSRTYGSFKGPTVSASSMFGPGWSASVNGMESGAAGMQVIDNSMIDGTVVLSSPESFESVFAPSAGWSVRTSSALKEGTWEGVDELTPTLGLKAEVSGSGIDTRFILTDESGTVTTFKATTAPSASAPVTFAPESVQGPGVGRTTYTRDSQGRIIRVLGALPAGMAPSDCPRYPDATHPWSGACRALEFDYASATTATSTVPGDISGQVQRIRFRTPSPTQPAGATRTMVSYEYDAHTRLVTATDGPTGMVTRYQYNSDGELVSVAAPGLTPYQLEYADADGRLARVKRDRPETSGGGTATLATVVYNLRPDILVAGLPDMRFQILKTAWAQGDAPVYGAAVFGPDRPIATRDPSQIASDDWAYASLWYTDVRGRLTNTATFGANQWRPTYFSYDAYSNVVRQLTAGDIDAIKRGDLAVGDAGTITVYNSVGNGPSGLPAGTVVTDVYETARPVRSESGTLTLQRPHTRTTYDENSPNGGLNPQTGQPWGLPTTVSTEAVEPTKLASVGSPTSVVKNEYGDVQGWTLGTRTSSRVVMTNGQADIVTTSKYDAAGRVTEVRQPESTGGDAGTRLTVYYTKAENLENPYCGGKPDWEGLVCKIAYAGGSPLPSTVVDGYDQEFLLPSTTTVSSGNVVRKTHTTYDSAGRSKKAWTTLTGASSIPPPGSELEYDPATGLLIRQWATDASGARTSERIDNGYDAWGRETSYAASGEPASITAYDGAGRISSVTDSTGTTTYAYDGNDATGAQERRGLVTKMSVTRGTNSQDAIEFAAAYDGDGRLVYEGLPGGMARRSVYDTAGQRTAASYSGDSNGDVAGSSTANTEQPWLSWNLDYSADGKVVAEWTPDTGAARFSGDPMSSYSKAYVYDAAGRLTRVNDKTAAGSAEFDSAGNTAGSACTTRTYSYDRNGNRLSRGEFTANPDGTCATTVGTTRTWQYDAADRFAAGSGYVYDSLGRITSIPATDTPATQNGQAAGALSLSYYDSDALRSMTQDGVTTTYTLDPAGRRRTETSGPAGATPTRSSTAHYSDASDSPTWIESTTPNGTTATRYVEGLDGGLGATITGGVASLTLQNPHGDVVAVVPVPNAGDATEISAWNGSDEFGNALKSPAPLRTETGIAYGWLGASQRATADTGLVLLGSRVYNPVTATFSSADPITGGNSTSYSYPQDPINGSDITGNESYQAYDAKKLFSACRKAGGGYVKCGKMLRFTELANKEANQFVQNYASNAYRHFIWSSGLAALFGSKIARAVTNAHEGKDKSLDSKVDRRNNRVGIRFGRSHKDDISEEYEDGDWDFLFSNWMSRYKGHKLWVINRKGSGIVRSCTHGRMNSC